MRKKTAKQRLLYTPPGGEAVSTCEIHCLVTVCHHAKFSSPSYNSWSVKITGMKNWGGGTGHRGPIHLRATSFQVELLTAKYHPFDETPFSGELGTKNLNISTLDQYQFTLKISSQSYNNVFSYPEIKQTNKQTITLSCDIVRDNKMKCLEESYQ